MAVKRVLSDDAKRMLTRLLSNAIVLIESDEISDGYHLGYLASHLELVGEIADDHDHFEKARLGTWGAFDDNSIREKLQAGEDWEPTIAETSQGYEHLRLVSEKEVA
jgi:hypothetical protein